MVCHLFECQAITGIKPVNWTLKNKRFIQNEYERHVDGLMQERRNSIANALELRLSCINPSIS